MNKIFNSTPQRWSASPLRALRSWTINQLRHRPLGVPAAAFFRAVGAEGISRKISLLCEYVPGVVDVYIRDDRTNSPSFRMDGGGGRDLVARALAWGGWAAYERPLPDLVLAFSREARFVLDVGSYSGLYSMIAASCPGVEKCYAFEPLPEARARLERNVALNRLGGRIEVVASAVGERAGTVDFYVPTATTGPITSSATLNPQFHREHFRTIQVPLVTLDEFAGRNACRPVGLMKIDVESQEHRVLLGMKTILREDRPVIFIEILNISDCRALESLRAEFHYACGLLQLDGICWRDKVEFVFGQWDQVFCPAEKLDHFNEVVRSIGYRVW